jgi:hypothetical protein
VRLDIAIEYLGLSREEYAALFRGVLPAPCGGGVVTIPAGIAATSLVPGPTASVAPPRLDIDACMQQNTRPGGGLRLPALSRQTTTSRQGAKQIRFMLAATASCHCAAAPARKVRSVDRGTRCRCRLNVLWTLACRRDRSRYPHPNPAGKLDLNCRSRIGRRPILSSRDVAPGRRDQHRSETAGHSAHSGSQRYIWPAEVSARRATSETTAPGAKLAAMIGSTGADAPGR